MGFRVLSKDEIYRGRVFRLSRNRVRLPNGRVAMLDLIEHPGAVAVVPLLDDGRVVLLRQFRLAARGDIWEIPAGTREPGEPPAVTARREVAEETGYAARRLQPLLRFFAAPGVSTEVMYLYLATGLTPGRAAPEAYECLKPKAVPLARALAMIREGKVRDAKSIIGLMATRDLLEKRAAKKNRKAEGRRQRAPVSRP